MKNPVFHFKITLKSVHNGILTHTKRTPITGFLMSVHLKNFLNSPLSAVKILMGPDRRLFLSFQGSFCPLRRKFETNIDL